MTIDRFIYLTDTHIGANPIGYHRQPAYPEKISFLLDRLDEVISKQSIDFIVHGGDLVDTCEEGIVKEAYDLFQLPVPVYLCLGNHDLDKDDSVNILLEHAPNLFEDGKPSFKGVHHSCVIHIVPNHWEAGKEYFWEEKQDPFFSRVQLENLERGIQKYPEKVHILVTHSPVFGVYPEQSGLEEIIHESPSSFQEQVLKIIEKHPNVKLVLSGHSHMNTIKTKSDTAFVTGSSFIESPFEYKVIEVRENSIRIETHQLPVHDSPSFHPKYDSSLKYVSGRKKDRDLLMTF